MNKNAIDKAMYIVGIVVAAGGLFTAIFDKGDDLKDQVADLQKRIKELEDKGRA